MNVLSCRPWQKFDAMFIIGLRNKPELMKWFRQDKKLTLKAQLKFMDSLEGASYHGVIICLDKKRIGVGSVKASGELTLVLPDKYKAARTEIIWMLILTSGVKKVWGEVFVGNDIAKDLEDIGFKPKHTLYTYENPYHV